METRKSGPNVPFGQVCVELGNLAPRQVDSLLAEYRLSLPLGELLAREGWITRDQLCEALSRPYDLPFLHLANVAPEPDA